MLRASLRLLDRADLDAALALCDRDRVANAFVASRLLTHGISRAGAGELWGYFDDGELISMCWSGANLVPVEATPDAAEAFALRAKRAGRQCSSLVGPAHVVMSMWKLLSPSWGGSRDVRPDQPLMSIDTPPPVRPDPLVRRAALTEVDLVTPACVAMFTEEVGYSPVAADGGLLYQSQVSSLVVSGRSLVRIQDGDHGPEVVFKAELGSVTPQVVQVQGVWVNPRHRGRGIAVPAMASVVRFCQEYVAPTTSLYVNAYNVRAIHVYERVGFQQVGTFATVLF